MSIIPVLVVDPIEFGPTSADPFALLDLACVGGEVRDVWGRWLQALSELDPIEVTTASDRSDTLSLADLVADPLRHVDPFDVLLFVTARLLPLEPDGLLGLREVARTSVRDGARQVVHLLAESEGSGGHVEVVYAPTDGAIHRIQRYLAPDEHGHGVPLGVIASVVPVRHLLGIGAGSAITSLDDLRSTLVQRGVPATDRTDARAHFDLATEEGALSFVQQRTRAHHLMHGGRDTARRRGPVVIEAGAEVADDALLVGPTYIAAGARVGAGARIAQSVLLDGADVPAGATLRHCIAGGDWHSAAIPLRRQRAMSTPTGEPVVPRQSLYLRIRPALESVVAAIALMILSPFLLLIAVAVKLTSDGPVLYHDRREGRGARAFDCLKFRTMRVNAHAQQRQLKAEQYADGPHFKMVNDPRLTPIGGLLRRLNLDELPQLVNVLRGEMSFVGPRPSPLRENQICAPWRQARLSVTPGITGLWQVCRRDRTAGDFHQWIEFDLLYVEHVSLAVDLRIFWATIRTRGGQFPVPVEHIIREAGTSPRATGHELAEAALSSTQVALGDRVALERTQRVNDLAQRLLENAS